jgi:hypothetical protein
MGAARGLERQMEWLKGVTRGQERLMGWQKGVTLGQKRLARVVQWMQPLPLLCRQHHWYVTTAASCVQ